MFYLLTYLLTFSVTAEFFCLLTVHRNFNYPYLSDLYTTLWHFNEGHLFSLYPLLSIVWVEKFKSISPSNLRKICRDPLET